MFIFCATPDWQGLYQAPHNAKLYPVIFSIHGLGAITAETETHTITLLTKPSRLELVRSSRPVDTASHQNGIRLKSLYQRYSFIDTFILEYTKSATYNDTLGKQGGIKLLRFCKV